MIVLKILSAGYLIMTLIVIITVIIDEKINYKNLIALLWTLMILFYVLVK